jgi:hypothetical protein
MDMRMDMHEMPGHRGDSTGKGLLRRRVVFELAPEQLPLLEAAQERHGSKRAALIAALEAEAVAAEPGRREKSKGKGKADAPARRERELAELKEQLAEREAELQDLRARAVDRIYCERCGEWTVPEEWSWHKLGNGSYAFHAPCGDQAEGEAGSSWLALREAH